MLPRPVRRVNPFQEDPVIVPAGEGAVTVTLKGVNASLTTKNGLHFDARGTLDINGNSGSFHVSIGPGGTEAGVTGLDLATLRPLIGRGLGGLLTLHFADRALQAEIEGLVMTDPPIRESKITFVAEPGEDAATTIVAVNPDGSLDLNATVTVADRMRFRVDGTVPRETAFGRDAGKGTLRVNLSGSLGNGLVSLAGTANLTGQDHDPLELDLDVDYYTHARGIIARKALAVSGDNRVAVKGKIDLRRATGRLTGSVDMDLDQLTRLLRPFVTLDESFSLAGRATLPSCEVRGKAGSLVVDAAGSIRDLVVGYNGEEARHPEARIDIAATVDRNFDRIEITRINLPDCELTGSLKHLSTRAPTGFVKGTIRITPVIVGLAGLAGIRFDKPVAGEIGIDLKTGRDPTGVSLSGQVNGTALHYGEIQKDIAVTIHEAGYASGSWSGKAAVVVDGMTIHTRLDEWSGDEGRGQLWMDPTPLQQLLRDVPLDDLELGGGVEPVVGIKVDGSRVSAVVTLDGREIVALVGERGPRDEPVYLKATVTYDIDEHRVDVDETTLTIGREFKLTGSGAWQRSDNDVTGSAHVTARADVLRRMLPELETLSLGGRFELDVESRDGAVGGKLIARGFALEVDGKRPEVDALSVSLSDEQLRIDLDGQVLSGQAKIGRDGAELSDLTGRIEHDLIGIWLPKGITVTGGAARWPFDGSGAMQAKGKLSAGTFRLRGTIVEEPFVELDMDRAAGAKVSDTRFHARAGATRIEGDDQALVGLSIEARSRPPREPADAGNKNLGQALRWQGSIRIAQFRSGEYRGRDVALTMRGDEFGNVGWEADAPYVQAEDRDELVATGLRLDGKWRDVPWMPDGRHLLLAGIEAKSVRTPTVSLRDLFAEIHWGRGSGRKLLHGSVKSDTFKATLNHGKLSFASIEFSFGSLRLGRNGYAGDRAPAWDLDNVILKRSRFAGNPGNALRIVIPMLIEQENQKITARGRVGFRLDVDGVGVTFDAIERSANGTFDVTIQNFEIANSRVLNYARFDFDDQGIRRTDRVEIFTRIERGRVVMEDWQTIFGDPKIQIKGSASFRGVLDYKAKARVHGTIKGPVDDVSVTFFK